jgi:hypothetical protein
MKIRLAFMLIAIAFASCGCNQYITAESGKDIYYGAFRNIDLSHSDVQLFNQERKCAGILFLDNSKKATKDEAGKKNSDAFVQLNCSDGKIIQAKLSAYTVSNWTGTGIDQFNNKYEFKVIPKKKYYELSNKQKIRYSSYKPAVRELVKY